MRCQNCGAELEEGVKFCRECGSKVIENKKRFCRECGTELPEGVKFCPECGANVAQMNEQLAQAEAYKETDESWNTVKIEKEVRTLPKIPMGVASGSSRMTSKNSFNKGVNLKQSYTVLFLKLNGTPFCTLFGTVFAMSA